MSEAALFFQSLMINEHEIGTHNLIEGTYIERLNLTCPKLILKLADPDKLYQDTMKLRQGAILTLSLGDVDSRGNALFQEKFFVGSVYEKNKQLIVEAMQEDIHRIKQPLAKPHFFIDKTPKEILGTIFPEHKLDLDSFNIRKTYHCTTNSTYSLVLNQMIKDYGAALWLERGTVYMRDLMALSEQKPVLTLEYNKNSSENSTIHKYIKYDTKAQKVRKNQHNYFTWNRTKGIEQIGNAYSRVYLPLQQKADLKQHNIMISQLMDAYLAGDGRYTAGLMLKLELNRMTVEQTTDESVPSKQLLTGVRHFQHGQQFLTVCECGEILNAN